MELIPNKLCPFFKSECISEGCAHWIGYCVHVGRQPKKRGPRIQLETDEQFIQTLKVNPAYKGVDIETELGKIDAWLLTPKGNRRKKTRAFVLRWLNKADRVMSDNSDRERLKAELKSTESQLAHYKQTLESIPEEHPQREDYERRVVSIQKKCDALTEKLYGKQG